MIVFHEVSISPMVVSTGDWFVLSVGLETLTSTWRRIADELLSWRYLTDTYKTWKQVMNW